MNNKATDNPKYIIAIFDTNIFDNINKIYLIQILS